MLNRFAIFALVCLCVSTSSGVADGTTYWQGAPGAVGDWFDPSNWTNGIPSSWINSETIDNNGTARIAAGLASGGILRVASEQDGGLIVDGGRLEIIYSLLVGSAAESHGNITINEGTLKSQSIELGSNFGTGSLLQNGGNVDVLFLELGGRGNWGGFGEPTDFGKGNYKLVKGSLHSAQLKVGSAGVGTFRQYSGEVSIDGQLTVGGSIGAQPPLAEFHATPINATSSFRPRAPGWVAICRSRSRMPASFTYPALVALAALAIASSRPLTKPLSRLL